MAVFRFLGRLSDIQGLQDTLTVPKHISTVKALRRWLNGIYETDQLTCASVRVVVNDVIVTDSQSVTDTDDIAFFPPVGGG